ncbi:ribosomal protein S18-alanine N-acetyltransferase [Insulibacter thermoxylanivorax]
MHHNHAEGTIGEGLSRDQDQELQVEIRSMTLEDIPQVMEVEYESFTIPWSVEAFHNELRFNQHAHYVVMIHEGQVIGYAGMWLIIDEAHITNIALREKYRGRKLGSKLLQHVIDTALDLGAERMTLEVRVTNRIAQNLYKKHGFRPAGLRKGYYTDNNEDAIIMWANIAKGRDRK